MRILHVETGRHFYGGPRQVMLLLAGLHEAGHQNLLLCPEGSEIAERADGCEVLTHPIIRGDLEPGLGVALRRAARQFSADIVHLHSRRGADWVGALAMTGTSIPVVLSRRVDNYEGALIARLHYRLVDRVIAISERIRSVLLQQGVPADKVICVPDAVPPVQQYPRDRDWVAQQFDIPPGVALVGVIAQLIRRKGHRHLLRALLEPPLADRVVHVLLLGQGPEAASLRQRVRQSGLGGRVHFAGLRREVDRILPNLDIVVHPAELEGLGVAVLEAAAAGRPVVAAAAGGIPEVVIDGETGLLVPPADPPALAAAIRRLLDQPELAAELGRSARVRVAEQFSVAKMVAGNDAVYRQLVS